MKVNPKYDSTKNKSIFFFSASATKHVEILFEMGIREILVSYYYIRKRPQFFAEFLPMLKQAGGKFMTDSGGFSFIHSNKAGNKEDFAKADFWKPYLEEYVGWLNNNKDYVDVLVNLDLDDMVGREVVSEWNQQYFEPMMKEKKVVYVAHKDNNNLYSDPTGLKHFKEYMSLYPYVGVSADMINYAGKIASAAAVQKKIIHGFGWTSIPTLKSHPFFSCDSTTWLGGARYGTSYMFDGKNFRVNDYKKKHLRKTDKLLCRDNDIDFDELTADREDAVNKFNLLGWIGARNEYLKIANLKLRNLPVSHYLK